MPNWNHMRAQLPDVRGVMPSRTAFNTSGALQDPVPASLHFKKLFQRSSCSGHRVLEGTGSACKHVLCVRYVHCSELSRALHALETWESCRRKLRTWNKAEGKTQKAVKNTIKYRNIGHTRPEKDGSRRRRLDLMDEEYALIGWGWASKGSSHWEGM
jgi:hypothetical protein